MADLPWRSLRPSPDMEHSMALRVDEDLPWDFFWGHGVGGEPQLLFRVPAGVNFPEQRDIPRIRNIDIRLASLDEWNWCVVELRDRAFEDIFHALCLALIEAVRMVGTTDGVMSLVARHLGRWQRMLGKTGAIGLLSQQERIGLIGELLFLGRHVLNALPDGAAVSSWVAPAEHPQDFDLPNGKVVEVKCRVATSPGTVHISSQWQLHQEAVPLFLAVFTIGGGERGNQISLHSLVQELRARLAGNAVALDDFEVSLFQRGYVDHPVEYDERWWIPRDLCLFSVEGDFPRLLPAQLPEGVIDVNYVISLPECESWKIPIKSIFE